jgi:hypothetical protein
MIIRAGNAFFAVVPVTWALYLQLIRRFAAVRAIKGSRQQRAKILSLPNEKGRIFLPLCVSRSLQEGESCNCLPNAPYSFRQAFALQLTRCGGLIG